MNWNADDTIAAIATANGNGGIAIVRISGPEAAAVLEEIFEPARGRCPEMESHSLNLGWLKDGDEKVDRCMAVIMRAPRSYTREDVAELQVHGGGYTAQRALELCLRHGARLAGPGEFTARAFRNGRVDLSQAEAVMALISARSDRAHRQAMHQLQGGTARFIREISDELYRLRAGLAACLDYPEEISDEEAIADLLPGVEHLADKLEKAADERRSRMVASGMEVVLFGRPNVGKSSLLNALLGEDRAIVTDIPGTTRDTVQGEMNLGADLFHLTDTAGMRETEDVVEQAGVQRSRDALDRADIALLVLDAAMPLQAEDLELAALLTKQREARNGIPAAAVLLNKADLPSAFSVDALPEDLRKLPCMTVSARLPESLGTVREYLKSVCRDLDMPEICQPRHLEAATRAAAFLRSAAETMKIAPVDLASPDLDAAQNALAEITGDQVTEKLLDQVFDTFCVGK